MYRDLIRIRISSGLSALLLFCARTSTFIYTSRSTTALTICKLNHKCAHSKLFYNVSCYVRHRTTPPPRSLSPPPAQNKNIWFMSYKDDFTHAKTRLIVYQGIVSFHSSCVFCTRNVLKPHIICIFSSPF